MRSKTRHTSLSDKTKREGKREREGQRGEIPNHRVLLNSISLLPHGCVIHYDHTGVRLFGDTFGILHPFPELGQASSPIPMPHSPFQHPSPLTYCHRSWSWPVCVQVSAPPRALRGREQGEPQTHVYDHCKRSENVKNMIKGAVKIKQNVLIVSSLLCCLQPTQIFEAEQNFSWKVD